MLITVHGRIWNTAKDDALVGHAENILTKPGVLLIGVLKQPELPRPRFTSESESLGPMQRLWTALTEQGLGPKVSEGGRDSGSDV